MQLHIEEHGKVGSFPRPEALRMAICEVKATNYAAQGKLMERRNGQRVRKEHDFMQHHRAETLKLAPRPMGLSRYHRQVPTYLATLLYTTLLRYRYLKVTIREAKVKYFAGAIDYE